MIFLLQAERGFVLRRNSWCLHPHPFCSKLANFSFPFFFFFFNHDILILSCVFPMWQMKYTQRVVGLILVSPICKAPSWSEWLYIKVIRICAINIMKEPLGVNIQHQG